MSTAFEQQKPPRLVRLRYGTIYCEDCRTTIDTGDPVAWWTAEERTGVTGLCKRCHRERVEARVVKKDHGYDFTKYD
jgi:hypothetical protein